MGWLSDTWDTVKEVAAPVYEPVQQAAGDVVGSVGGWLGSIPGAGIAGQQVSNIGGMIQNPFGGGSGLAGNLYSALANPVFGGGQGMLGNLSTDAMGMLNPMGSFGMDGKGKGASWQNPYGQMTQIQSPVLPTAPVSTTGQSTNNPTSPATQPQTNQNVVNPYGGLFGGAGSGVNYRDPWAFNAAEKKNGLQDMPQDVWSK